MKVIRSISISLILMTALMSGGLLHAVIPHTHGDDGHGQSHESAEWSDLHGALSHDDKKVFVAIFAVVVLALISLVSTQNVSLAYLRGVSFAGKARDPNAGELLRRGIHRYRAFG